MAGTVEFWFRSSYLLLDSITYILIPLEQSCKLSYTLYRYRESNNRSKLIMDMLLKQISQYFPNRRHKSHSSSWSLMMKLMSRRWHLRNICNLYNTRTWVNAKTAFPDAGRWVTVDPTYLIKTVISILGAFVYDLSLSSRWRKRERSSTIGTHFHFWLVGLDHDNLVVSTKKVIDYFKWRSSHSKRPSNKKPKIF